MEVPKMSRPDGARPALTRAVHQTREVIARAARPVLWGSRTEQGFRYGRRLAPSNGDPTGVVAPPAKSSIEEYWDAHTDGPGIWKFRHYFEIYHRHFSKFIGTEVHVAEIGVYSGGSLNMWKEYFGPKS